MANEQIRTLTQLLEDFEGGQEPNLKIRNLIVSLYNAIPSGAAVANGQVVSVRTSAGADPHNGTAVVQAGTPPTLTGINLSTASMALVDNADSISVRNSAGGDGHGGFVQVAAGAAGSVNLQLATVVMVDDLDTFPVNTFGGVSVTGTASVAANALGGVALAATNAIIVGGVTDIPIGDATAVANGQDTALDVPVAGGLITRATLPGTDKIMKSGVTYPCGTITGAGTNLTPTIVNGVMTGGVLS